MRIVLAFYADRYGGPQGTTRLRRTIQDALGTESVTVLADAGHYAPAERPDAFARAMLDWSP